MEIDKALRVALLGCHRAQLIEALGYGFLEEAKEYWEGKRLETISELGARLRAEFPALLSYRSMAAKLTAPIDLRDVVDISDEKRSRSLRVIGGRCVDETGEVKQREWLRLRLLLHLIFDPHKNGYKWSIQAILRLGLAHHLGHVSWYFDFGPSERRHVELEECWARGLMGLDAIPAILERLEEETVNVDE